MRSSAGITTRALGRARWPRRFTRMTNAGGRMVVARGQRRRIVGSAHHGADRGAALVEFSLVFGLLMLLLTGIVSYGLILGYRQTLMQAANDGARAAAIAGGSTDGPGDRRVTAAIRSLDETLAAYGRRCVNGAVHEGLRCEVTISACGIGQECITIDLHHDNQAVPIGIDIVPLKQLTPAAISVQATALVSP